MLDPLVSAIIAVNLALMLLLASAHKLAEFGQFREILADYRLLPSASVTLVAVLVPVAEMVLGLAWLFRDSKMLPALATAALLSLYTAGIAINLFRGRVHISCGCGFAKRSSAGDALSWRLVMRNAVIMGVALTGGLPVSSRALGAADHGTLVAATLLIALLFAAASQLMRNSAEINTWRRPVARDD